MERALSFRSTISSLRMVWRQVRLTDAGLRLLHSVQQALDLVAGACSDASHRGTRIAAPVELAYRFFPRVIGDFSPRFPGLVLHILVHDSDSNGINSAVELTADVRAATWPRALAYDRQAVFMPEPNEKEGVQRARIDGRGWYSVTHAQRFHSNMRLRSVVLDDS